MAKYTQNYKLYEVMKSGEILSKEKIAEILEVKLISVPVYIHELKAQFKAQITSVREGRKVVGYKMDPDAPAITVPQYRRNSSEDVQTKKTVSANNSSYQSDDGSLPLLDKDALMVTERDVADLHEMLAITPNNRGEW